MTLAARSTCVSLINPAASADEFLGSDKLPTDFPVPLLRKWTVCCAGGNPDFSVRRIDNWAGEEWRFVAAKRFAGHRPDSHVTGAFRGKFLTVGPNGQVGNSVLLLFEYMPADVAFRQVPGNQLAYGRTLSLDLF
jgi:hypothetical protein